MKIRKHVCMAAVLMLGGCSSSRPMVAEREGVVRVRGSEARELLSRSRTSAQSEYASPARRAVLLDRANEMLIEATEATDPQMRAHAYEALVQEPELLDGVIERGLLDENYGVRSIAAMAVGKAKLEGHMDTLRILAADESPFVSTSAIYSLVTLGEDVDRTPLADALLQDRQPELRSHAAFLLGEIGDSSALPLLRDAARRTMPRSMSAQVRLSDLQLSEAMAKLGDEDQLEPLRAALFPAQPSDLEATALAVQILGELGDEASRGTLAQLAETKGPTGESMPPEILLTIAITMAKLGDLNGWYLADRFWESDRIVLRADSAAVYGWTARDEDLAKLELMLSDPVGVVRVAAASALVRRLKVSDV
ncbi:MAG TPA: hypothetical protein ENJ00_03640 [Phycisphaerales bacterium]|nr:hypothetical protein [Phycisphaerales bacterium]